MNCVKSFFLSQIYYILCPLQYLTSERRKQDVSHMIIFDKTILALKIITLSSVCFQVVYFITCSNIFLRIIGIVISFLEERGCPWRAYGSSSWCKMQWHTWFCADLSVHVSPLCWILPFISILLILLAFSKVWKEIIKQ